MIVEGKEVDKNKLLDTLDALMAEHEIFEAYRAVFDTLCRLEFDYDREQIMKIIDEWELNNLQKG